MPNYRMTMFFGQANMGWSESYWYGVESITGLVGVAQALLNGRAALLTDIHEIDGFRISIEGDARRGRLCTAGPNQITRDVILSVPAKGTYPAGSNPTKFDQVRACMQIGYYNAGTQYSIRYFDGVPDELTATENDSLNRGVPPLWWSRWRNFSNFIVNQGVQIKVLNKTLANPERPVIKWVLRAAEPNVLGLVLAGAGLAGVSVGDRINVRGVRSKYAGIRTPNGQWIVDQIAVDDIAVTQTIYLRGATAFDPTMIKTLGYVRKWVPTYLAPDIIETIRAGIHKRGKRFGTPRGRRRVIAYAN